MARLALTSLRTVRGLAECTPASIMACVMTASQLGLEPGVLGSCYLIPRKGEATFLIGYQGLLDLIRRSGKVTSIASRVVFETDRFDLDYAASIPFTHKPDLRRKDNRILGFYCHATLAGGEHLFEWMPLHEVNAIRGRSQSGSSGPWATDFSEMGKKTVLRRAAKYLPRSIEFSDALAADDHVDVVVPIFTLAAAADIRQAVQAARETEKPVALLWTGGCNDDPSKWLSTTTKMRRTKMKRKKMTKTTQTT
jgi:recombination protein RecT